METKLPYTFFNTDYLTSKTALNALLDPILLPLLDLNTVFSDPIVPLNKDLTNFSTNNTNSQVSVTATFDDGTYLNLFCFGQSNNISNQDLPYLRRCLKTANIEDVSNWQWYEDANGPINILPPGSGGSWDDDQLFIGTVMPNTDDIVSDGRTYIAYYCGYDGSTNYQIGIATSDDLISWTKYGSNPIFVDTNGGVYSLGNLWPKVVRISANNYVMYYTGTQVGGIQVPCRAISTDGLNWTVSDREILGAGVYGKVGTLTPINDNFYFMFTKIDASGNDCDPVGSRVTNGGPFRDVHLYSTSNFSTVTDQGVIFSNNGEIGEGWGTNGGFLQSSSGNWFTIIGRYKWDIQAYNALTNGEQFSEGHMLKASFSNVNVSEADVAYPDYVDFYDVTQLKEVTGKGYTGAWESSPEVDIVNWISPQTNHVIFDVDNWDLDRDNFALKTKIYIPSTETGTKYILASVGGTSANNVMSFLISANSPGGSLLNLILKGSGGVTKNYKSVNPIYDYMPSVSNNDTIDVGFIWNAGTLKMCIGYNTDVPVTKTTDDVFTQLNAKIDPLQIGGRTGVGEYGQNMTGVATILGTSATEANWLKLSLF